MSKIVVAGNDVYTAQQARKAAALGVHQRYNSTALCNWQEAEHNRGIVEAEIVMSMYGYSLRYASGLLNWGLIASCRSGELDGTYECAVARARRWAVVDPNRRYVTAQAVS